MSNQSIDNIDDIDLTIFSDKVVEVARKRAIKKTLKWFQSQVRKLVSKDLNLTQKNVKQRTFANITDGYLWVGLNTISAHKWGKGKKGGEGVTNKAGLHSGAFSASMNGGDDKLIMIRLGKQRLPIEKVEVDVKNTILIACGKVRKLAIERFKIILLQELNYAANHEKR